MSESLPESTTVLTVRGDAHVEIPPDVAELACALRVSKKSKQQALRVVAQRLDAVLNALRGMGGAPMTAGAQRGRLTWTVYSASTHPDTERDDSGRLVRTGRIVATVGLRIAVREFALLDALDSALSRQQDLHVHHVDWSVDADNEAWKQLRTEAVTAAIQQGRDYAAALGAGLLRIESLEDIALGGDETGRKMHGLALASRALRSEGDDLGAPPLDPLPQELQAVVEARFVASLAALTP